jgi:hypothetical protein
MGKYCGKFSLNYSSNYQQVSPLATNLTLTNKLSILLCVLCELCAFVAKKKARSAVPSQVGVVGSKEILPAGGRFGPSLHHKP